MDGSADGAPIRRSSTSRKRLVLGVLAAVVLVTGAVGCGSPSRGGPSAAPAPTTRPAATESGPEGPSREVTSEGAGAHTVEPLPTPTAPKRLQMTDATMAFIWGAAQQITQSEGGRIVSIDAVLTPHDRALAAEGSSSHDRRLVWLVQVTIDTKCAGCQSVSAEQPVAPFETFDLDAHTLEGLDGEMGSWQGPRDLTQLGQVVHVHG